MKSALAIAQEQLDRGNQPVLCRYGTKRPIVAGWPAKRYTAADLPQVFNGAQQAVGCQTGAASGGLVDVDLDAREAVLLGCRFLPKTGARFGRPGKRGSHWQYYPEPLPDTRQFEDPDPPDDDR